MPVSTNKQMKNMDANPAYLLSNSKESIAIVALVVRLNGVRVLRGPWLLLFLDEPLAYVMCMRTGHKVGANMDRYLLSHGVIFGVALNLVAFSGAVALQIEHEASANVSDVIHSIGERRYCIRCRFLMG